MKQRDLASYFAPLATLILFVLTVMPAASASERYTFQHEHVLGTSLEIQLQADSEQTATQAEALILSEIERLAAIFSSYDPQSELNKWQQTRGLPVAVSQELFDILAACDAYHQQSQGAFHPAVERLSQLWKQAEERQQSPNAQLLTAAVNQLQQPQWKLDHEKRTATRLGSSPLKLDAIAKGAIIDQTCRATMNSGLGIQGVMVNIGGDLGLSGDLVAAVKITDPLNDAENADEITTIFLNQSGVATSGNYRRGFQIGNEHVSHIIDPRSGKPVDQIVSATVVASTTTQADALATIFSVLTPDETASLAATLTDVEYFLIDSEGKHHHSAGWKDLEQPGLYRFSHARTEPVAFLDSEGSSAAELLELTVKFELNRPSGSQYRRPYVAIWLEDADEFPVRTGLLWMQTEQPGPRWHRDLLRWYRNDSVRKLADGKELIGTISGATRGPGAYKAVFDGKDDAGNPLPAGKYTLFIEVAREHGTYQLIRQAITLGTEPIAETKLKTNVEIKSASFEYRSSTTSSK